MQNLLKKRWFIDKKEIASQHSWQADDPKTEKTNKSVLTSTFTRQTWCLAPKACHCHSWWCKLIGACIWINELNERVWNSWNMELARKGGLLLPAVTPTLSATAGVFLSSKCTTNFCTCKHMLAMEFDGLVCRCSPEVPALTLTRPQSLPWGPIQRKTLRMSRVKSDELKPWLTALFLATASSYDFTFMT